MLLPARCRQHPAVNGEPSFVFSHALGPSTAPTGRARCPHRAAARRAGDSPPYLMVHGKPPSALTPCIGTRNRSPSDSGVVGVGGGCAQKKRGRTPVRPLDESCCVYG